MGIEIVKVFLFILSMIFLAEKHGYGYIALIWIEDVILQIPMIYITTYLNTYINDPIVVFLVFVGTIFGIIIAIFETI